MKYILLFTILFDIFIPFISNSSTPVNIGVDAFPTTTTDLDIISSYNIKLITVGTNLKWQDYEPNINEFHEEYLDNYRIKIDDILNHHLIPIITIHGAPSWATINGGCSEIKPEYYDNFKNFVNKVILKFPEVKYFQIWNESDFIGGDINYYGCWGNPVTFSNLMKKVYELKTEDKDLYFSISIFMYATFLQDYINAGGEFDILNIHHYQFYYPIIGRYTFYPIDTYVNSLRSITTKPIWLTETNLIMDSPISTIDYEAYKSQYMIQIVNNSLSLNIRTIIFYSWNADWLNSNIEGQQAENTLHSLSLQYNSP